MPGPSPKLVRRRRNAPALGDWRAAPASGWQHGEIPTSPAGLTPESVWAWGTWFSGWFASHWTPGDVPAIRVIALLYDDCLRHNRASTSRELAAWMNAYGMTPKGQQLRRWLTPAGTIPVGGAAR